MKFLLETTVWESDIPNHTYILNEKDACIGYVKTGTDDVTPRPGRSTSGV